MHCNVICDTNEIHNLKCYVFVDECVVEHLVDSSKRWSLVRNSLHGNSDDHKPVKINKYKISNFYNGIDISNRVNDDNNTNTVHINLKIKATLLAAS